MPDKTAAAAERPNTPPIPRGDEPELFRRHHARLLRLVARDTGAPPALAEDACSFAWLQLLRHQPERQRIVGWLRVVARHEALRLQRQQWGNPPLRGTGQGGLGGPHNSSHPARADPELQDGASGH